MQGYMSPRFGKEPDLGGAAAESRSALPHQSQNQTRKNPSLWMNEALKMFGSTSFEKLRNESQAHSTPSTVVTQVSDKHKKPQFYPNKNIEISDTASDEQEESEDDSNEEEDNDQQESSNESSNDNDTASNTSEESEEQSDDSSDVEGEDESSSSSADSDVEVENQKIQQNFRLSTKGEKRQSRASSTEHKSTVTDDDFGGSSSLPAEAETVDELHALVTAQEKHLDATMVALQRSEMERRRLEMSLSTYSNGELERGDFVLRLQEQVEKYRSEIRTLRLKYETVNEQLKSLADGSAKILNKEEYEQTMQVRETEIQLLMNDNSRLEQDLRDVLFQWEASVEHQQRQTAPKQDIGEQTFLIGRGGEEIALSDSPILCHVNLKRFKLEDKDCQVGLGNASPSVHVAQHRRLEEVYQECKYLKELAIVSKEEKRLYKSEINALNSKLLEKQAKVEQLEFLLKCEAELTRLESSSSKPYKDIKAKVSPPRPVLIRKSPVIDLIKQKNDEINLDLMECAMRETSSAPENDDDSLPPPIFNVPVCEPPPLSPREKVSSTTRPKSSIITSWAFPLPLPISKSTIPRRHSDSHLTVKPKQKTPGNWTPTFGGCSRESSTS